MKIEIIVRKNLIDKYSIYVGENHVDNAKDVFGLAAVLARLNQNIKDDDIESPAEFNIESSEIFIGKEGKENKSLSKEMIELVEALDIAKKLSKNDFHLKPYNL